MGQVYWARTEAMISKDGGATWGGVGVGESNFYIELPVNTVEAANSIIEQVKSKALEAFHEELPENLKMYPIRCQVIQLTKW
jgi:hypothetical protein